MGAHYVKAILAYEEADLKKQAEFARDFLAILRGKNRAVAVFFQDEMSAETTARKGYGWTFEKRLVVRAPQAAWEKVNAFGAVNPFTGEVVELASADAKAPSFIRLLRKLLIQHPRKRVLLCLDNSRVHHSRMLQKFLEKHPRLQVKYLPAYSPELNPKEYWHAFVRKKLLNNRSFTSARAVALALNRFARNTPKEVEKEVYGDQSEFCRESDRVRKEEQREIERQEAKEEAERLKEVERIKRKERKEREMAAKQALLEAKQPLFEGGNCIQEKGLSKRQKDHLLSEEYSRIKVSPFGDSGAAFYWVKPRWPESKEHAFFCYLIEGLAKKHDAEDITLNVNDGPDIVFEHDKSTYAIEVETGGNLRRNEKYLQKKFYLNERHYDHSFVFVTSKKLKYKYGKYAHVITRGTLKKTLKQIFNKNKQTPSDSL
ncbi:IS630 family transposase [Candidatus Micrarchaeota archaeon]|nr:IS630 family transposase [Candidatus Micrarchaeota archaeon]